jgi:N,N-dimethylformamidase
VPAIPGAGTPRPQGVATLWYFVAASFDAATGTVTLYQEPLDRYPNDPTRVVLEEVTRVRALATNDQPLRIAAYGGVDGSVAGHYNGKIDEPRLYGRALSRAEVMAVAAGSAPAGALAAWDFAADIETDRVRDTAGRGFDGRTANLPTRAVTGHLWDATEMDYTRAREQYGAIHFHDDDLLDAGWDVGFAFEVPRDLRSGVYASRLRTTTSEDYVPFFVRPPRGTATADIALLMPTVSYLAYAGTGGTSFQPMSLYSTHTDGSGVTYSSRLRPITNMRPKIATRNPWQFMADTHLVDWLETKGFTVDVITEHDLHFEGAALLEPYNVVLTGTHPEYYSGEMLRGVRAYLEQGGRLMYMGGNGFYWVTNVDPSGTFIEVRRRDGTEHWQGAPGESYHSLTGEPGGLWRFRGLAPQWLVGVGFTAQGFDRNSPYRRMPDSFDPRAAFIFEGIGEGELIGNHPSLVLGFGAAGSELDRVDHALGSPPHTLILARSFGHSDAYQHVVEEVNTSNSQQGGTVNPLVYADIAYVEYPNGGAVFSTGSIAWSGSLSFNNYQNNVSRITENVLRRFASSEPLPGPTAGGPGEGSARSPRSP